MGLLCHPAALVIVTFVFETPIYGSLAQTDVIRLSYLFEGCILRQDIVIRSEAAFFHLLEDILLIVVEYTFLEVVLVSQVQSCCGNDLSRV